MKKFLKWEGFIVDVEEDCFWIQLEEVTRPDIPTMVISLHKQVIRERDQEWIQHGVPFQMFLRYYDDLDNPRDVGNPIFHFVKKRWTQEEIDKAKEMSEKLISFFRWCDNDDKDA